MRKENNMVRWAYNWNFSPFYNKIWDTRQLVLYILLLPVLYLRYATLHMAIVFRVVLWIAWMKLWIWHLTSVWVRIPPFKLCAVFSRVLCIAFRWNLKLKVAFCCPNLVNRMKIYLKNKVVFKWYSKSGIRNSNETAIEYYYSLMPPYQLPWIHVWIIKLKTSIENKSFPTTDVFKEGDVGGGFFWMGDKSEWNGKWMNDRKILGKSVSKYARYWIRISWFAIIFLSFLGCHDILY